MDELVDVVPGNDRSGALFGADEVQHHSSEDTDEDGPGQDLAS